MKLDTAILYDCETTGLNPEADRVLEVACGLFSIEHAKLIRATSWLFTADGNAAENVNGLPVAFLQRWGATDAGNWSEIADWLSQVDVIIAHRASFDRSFVPQRIMEVEEPGPWVCSCDDIEWPKGRPGKLSLVQLAVDHGLGIGSAHRALEDVLLLARLFERAAELGASPASLIARALRPKRKYRALVSYDDNHLAKAAGFRWDPEARIWWKAIVPDDLPALGFAFKVMEVSA